MKSNLITKFLSVITLSVFTLSVFVLANAPVQAQTPNTGLNIGIALSGNFVDLDIDETDTAAMIPVTETVGAGFDEFGVTLAVGYNLLIGAVIAGVIADLTLANFSDSYDDSKYSADYLATLRAQIGMQVFPGVIAYLTGGIAWTEASYRGVPAIAATPIARRSSNLSGWVYGVGAEINTGIDLGTGPVMARAEYLHGELSDWKFWKGTEFYKVETELDLVRVGVVIPLAIGAGN